MLTGAGAEAMKSGEVTGRMESLVAYCARTFLGQGYALPASAPGSGGRSI